MIIQPPIQAALFIWCVLWLSFDWKSSSTVREATGRLFFFIYGGAFSEALPGQWPRRHSVKQIDSNGTEMEAAKGRMVYGLWVEDARVGGGTAAQREQLDWIPAAGPGRQGMYLLNFSLLAVQDCFFRIVKGFMDSPGFVAVGKTLLQRGGRLRAELSLILPAEGSADLILDRRVKR